MQVRGIRGATVVDEDNPETILEGTKELLTAILTDNPDIKINDIASVIFTVTDDLKSTYPAKAARQLGWEFVPLLCTREIPVPGGLKKCIRVLLHWNTKVTAPEVNHVYLGKASILRPDL